MSIYYYILYGIVVYNDIGYDYDYDYDYPLIKPIN